MALTQSPKQAEQMLTGAALKSLREQAGKTQHDVGLALGMTGAGWQYYEAGRREFTPDKLSKALEAIDATEYDLDAEKGRILGRPAPAARSGDSLYTRNLMIDVYGRARAGPQGPEVYDAGEPLRTLDLRQLLGGRVDALQVAGDSMTPWAEPGELVIFDRDRYPKRGGGCVVELLTGEAYVKLYEKSDGSRLFVRELRPEERVITFEMEAVKGVYAIRLRGD